MAHKHLRQVSLESEDLLLLRDGHAHGSRDAVLHDLLRSQVAGSAISAVCDTAISRAVCVQVRKSQRRRSRYIQPGALPRDQDRNQGERYATTDVVRPRRAISEYEPGIRRRLLGPPRRRRLVRWVGAAVSRMSVDTWTVSISFGQPAKQEYLHYTTHQH